MAYVIGNTIQMPYQPDTLEMIGQSLLAGIQQAIQQKMMQQFAQQYNLVPVAVTDENGQIQIEWRYREPYEEKLRKIAELSNLFGTPPSVTMDAEGRLGAMLNPEIAVSLQTQAPDVWNYYQQLGVVPTLGEPIAVRKKGGLSGIWDRVKDLFRESFGLTSKAASAFTGNPMPLIQEGVNLISPAPVQTVNTAPKGTGALPAATKKKREMVKKFIPAKTRSFLEVKLRSPRGEYQWVDMAEWHKYRKTDYNDWTPIEVRPKPGTRVNTVANQLTTRMGIPLQ